MIYIPPWHVARMGEERGVYRVVVGKPEGKRPLGRPRLRWVDNILPLKSSNLSRQCYLTYASNISLPLFPNDAVT